ncbi:hypothetical protein BGX38DRAFT_1085618 [Terfezia claveryi]|nr:hypothetical protein BGX38DRAFT_1085618 [Terfezia claveryi]
MAAPINVVILGSNMSGNLMSHYILKHITPATTARPVKVTIISPSTKFYWTIAVPRALLNKPKLLKPEAIQVDIITHLVKNHGSRGDKWEFLEAWARGVDVDSSTITIEAVDHNVKETIIPYDHLIIATEDQLAVVAPFKPHGTTEETLSGLKFWGDKIAESNTILLVGGGPTGVELAGEVKDSYLKKKVILVTSGNVLPMLQPRVSLIAKNLLERLGVDVRINTKVTAVNRAPSGQGVEVVLSSGETVPADLFIPTLGQKPNTEFLPKEFLNSHGFVQTTDYLNLPSHPNIWAIGDVTHYEGNRKAITIDPYCQVLTWNLQKVIFEKGKVTVGEGAGWSKYKHNLDQMMFVPVGGKQGTGQVKTWRVWSFFVWLLKGRDYMVPWIVNSVSGSSVPKKLKLVA